MNDKFAPSKVFEAMNDLVNVGMGLDGTRAKAIHGGLQDTQQLCHGLAHHSGWWNGVDRTDKNVIGTKLALVHSEVSEALEGMRKDKMDDHLPHRTQIEVELADALIRIFDLAGALRLDLAGATIEKLAYNQKRADHKPENRAADGGKKV